MCEWDSKFTDQLTAVTVAQCVRQSTAERCIHIIYLLTVYKTNWKSISSYSYRVTIIYFLAFHDYAIHVYYKPTYAGFSHPK